MDDKVYAKKYRKGVSKVDLLGKLKQASDARHTQYLTGYTLGGGTAVRQAEPDTTLAVVDAGVEFYATNYLSSRVALTGFTGEKDLFVGGDIGVRLQPPTRLAPFVGVGSTLGMGAFDVANAAVQGAATVDDGMDEVQRDSSVITILYPETGVHFWLNGRTRLSAYGRHNFSTSNEGGSFEGWLVGGQFAIFRR